MNDTLNAQEPIFKEMVDHYKTIPDFPIDAIVSVTEPKHGWY